MKVKGFLLSVLFILNLVISGVVNAQISAPGATGSDKTSYPVYAETDSIFVFCTASEGSAQGILRATTTWEGTKTFNWEKYNEGNGNFETYFSESISTQYSEISGLADGCYRVTITQGANTYIQRAWVFNDWFSASSEITDSNCESFKLNGNFTTANLVYYDLTDNQPVELNKNVTVQWQANSEKVASVLSPQIFDPPAANTDYTLIVSDKYACQGTSTVTYFSIVTSAAFNPDKTNGEAPLTVSFNNNSLNGTSGQYEWFFFRDLNDIKKESESTGGPVDSISVVAYDDSPVYTYQNSGTYMVKLVSKKITGDQVCVDTVYMDGYITVDSSFIAVPNVFTPNGDGTNDEFVVKFWSMRTVKIDIFDRWGKRVHHWESGDVQGFDGTWTQTVWDGRGMGGRYASPGVYYYNVVGEGRDGEKRRANGFFHLFRGKD